MSECELSSMIEILFTKEEIEDLLKAEKFLPIYLVNKFKRSLEQVLNSTPAYRFNNPPSPNPEEWYIVSAQSGKSVEGFPMGEFLCPTLLDVSDCISEKRISDPMIRKYKKEPVTGTVYYEF